MKKLDIKLGGHQFFGDDLLFVQSSLAEAIVALATVSGETLVAIKGVEITVGGGNITWTAGWMVLSGELCQVDAGVAAYPANDTFVISETYDAAGNQTYEDLNVEDTYVIRKAKIQGNAGGANLYSNLTWMNMSAVKTWQDFTAITGFSWAPSASYNPLYRKNQTSGVDLAGSIERSNFNSAFHSPIGTLPAGYRPDKTIVVGVPGTINGVAGTIMLEISTTGDFGAIGITNGDDLILYMDGLSFPLK